MKRNLWAALLLCAVLSLSACGAPAAEDGASKSLPGQADAEPEASWEAAPVADESPDADADGGAETQSGGADFAKLAGTWLSDGGAGVLTVYENGGFMLETPDDTQYGYLAYTEEDGGTWESGPRYELYLENNERVPERYLAFDEQHPGKLVYAVGGGAELFSRGDSAYGADGVIFRVQWADESASGYDQFIANDGEYARGVVISAERALPDFKFLAISFEDVREDGMSVFAVEERYSQDVLAPERPLLIQTSFPGDMPNNGVSFTDDSGATRYFAIAESGYDGSLSVSEFERSATP